MKLKTVKERIVFMINCCVAAAISLPYIVQIDFSEITPRTEDWLLLPVLLVFTVVLFGTALWLVYYAIIAIYDRTPQALDNHDNLELSKTAFDTVFLATAFTMLLYFWGLTDSFFSFVDFYR